MSILRGLPSSVNQILLRSSKRVICRCRKKNGRMLYDFKEKEFIYEGGCYFYFLCAMIMKTKFEAWLKQNEEE